MFDHRIIFVVLGSFSLLGTPSSVSAQGSGRPPAIEAENVPEIPQATFARLQQYSSVRSAGFQGWHPQGKGILISTRFGNASQIHRVYTPGGRREQITFFEEPVRGGFLPKANDNALLLSMSPGGNENDQIYLLEPGTFQTLLLTDGVARNRINAIQDDGQRIVIASNQRNGRDTDLYVVDPRRPDSMKLVMETDREYWYAADWSPDNQTLLLGRYVSINESYWATLDLKSGQRTDLPLPNEQKGAISNLTFGDHGKSIYLSSDAQGEFRQLARYNLEAKEFEWLTEDIPWDVSSVTVDRNNWNLAFATNENGASKLYLIENGARRPLPLPLGIIGSLEFSPDSKHLGLTLARPDAPSDAYSIELATGKLTRWTFSEVGGLNPDSFVTPTRIEFESFDGRTIPAYYFRPPAASEDKNVPVLISIHGGPESQYRPYFSSLIQFYVQELGLAVIAPNVRGSAGYGKTYLKLDNAERREDSVKDIGALLDWIDDQPELDSSRVAVSGGSYGGYMVLASLVHYNDRIRAGIDIVGIANFITFLKNTADYRRDLRRAEYGDERDPAMQKVFTRINPTANADQIRSALLVAHGKNDPRVPFSEAQQIAEKVRAAGREVWTVYAGNEGHGFSKRDNSDYLRAVQVEFLRQSLFPSAND